MVVTVIFIEQEIRTQATLYGKLISPHHQEKSILPRIIYSFLLENLHSDLSRTLFVKSFVNGQAYEGGKQVCETDTELGSR